MEGGDSGVNELMNEFDGGHDPKSQGFLVACHQRGASSYLDLRDCTGC